MGLGSRDYYRDGYGDGDMDWNSDAPAVRGIIIATVAAFVLQLVWRIPAPEGVGGRESAMDLWFEMDSAKVLGGQVWRLVTYAFLHSTQGLWNIIFNMLMLWWFGPTLERMYGTKEFLAFYLTSAVAAAFGFLVWDLSMQQTSMMIGSSGAVLATAMLFTMHFPTQQIGLFFGLLMLEMRILMAIIVVIDASYIFANLGGRLEAAGEAHPAYLLGVAFGWAYFHFKWRISNFFGIWENLQNRWRLRKARQRFKVYSPEPPTSPLDDDVDRILAKIHEQGEASLTPRERETLTKASKAYRERL